MSDPRAVLAFATGVSQTLDRSRVLAYEVVHQAERGEIIDPEKLDELRNLVRESLAAIALVESAEARRRRDGA